MVNWNSIRSKFGFKKRNTQKPNPIIATEEHEGPYLKLVKKAGETRVNIAAHDFYRRMGLTRGQALEVEIDRLWQGERGKARLEGRGQHKYGTIQKIAWNNIQKLYE